MIRPLKALREKLTPKSKPKPLAEATNLNDFRGWGYGNSFLKSIYREDTRFMNPHERMRLGREAFMSNGHIRAAVEIYKKMVVGDHISVTTDDDKLDKKFNKFLKRADTTRAINEIIESLLITGNAYTMEKIKSKENETIIDLTTIPTPEKMHISFKNNGDVDKYILEQSRRYRKGGSHKIKNSYIGERVVHGISYKAKEITHTVWGLDETGLYGQSPILVSADDIKIMRELTKAIAIQARYKSIPKKAHSLLTPDGRGTVGQKAIKAFTRDIKTTNDYEDIITQAKIESTKLLDPSDLSLRDLKETLKFITQRAVSPLMPNFVLFGESTVRASTRAQKDVLYMSIVATQKLLASYLKKLFRKYLKAKDKSVDEIEFNFEKINMAQFDNPHEKIKDWWDKGFITLGYAQKRLGVPIDEEMEDFYKWEVQEKTGGSMRFRQDLKDAIAEMNEPT